MTGHDVADPPSPGRLDAPSGPVFDRRSFIRLGVVSTVATFAAPMINANSVQAITWNGACTAKIERLVNGGSAYRYRVYGAGWPFSPRIDYNYRIYKNGNITWQDARHKNNATSFNYGWDYQDCGVDGAVLSIQAEAYNAGGEWGSDSDVAW